jgi:putative SOS response-associated peptidase YedK
MCGRFTLRLNTGEIADHFDADPRGIEHPPRFNIAPEDPRGVLMIGWARDEERRALAEARWGLLPRWVDDPDDFPTLINARAETAGEKPSFRNAFRKRRCLIPADGFYEWLPLNGRKQPYFIRRKDDAPFAFAGLWEHWSGDGRSIDSCAILTCAPNDVVGEIHDRMPVILPEEHYDHWLRPETWAGDPGELLAPYPDPDEEFEAYPVSRRVNDPTYDAPELVERREDGDPGARAD